MKHVTGKVEYTWEQRTKKEKENNIIIMSETQIQ